MRKGIILLLLFMSSLIQVKAEDHIMFDKANQMYRNKLFDSAANLYQQLINDGFSSPDLYYNAGNAFYRLNKIGWSVWCYRKALFMKEDRNYRDNLKLAQRRIVSPIEAEPDIFFIRWWKSLYRLFSVNTWALLALLSFLVAMSTLFLKKMGRHFSGIHGLRNLAFVMSFVALILMGVRWLEEQYHYRGIIVKSATLFQPQGKGAALSLSEGVEVEFVRQGKVQMLVKLPDGQIGQIEASAFKKL